MIGLVIAALTQRSVCTNLRVAKVMTIDEEPRDRRPFSFSDVSLQGRFLWMITLPTLGLMLSWESVAKLGSSCRILFVRLTIG